MEELLQELAEAELGMQVMDTAGVAATKCNALVRQVKEYARGRLEKLSGL